MNCNFFFATIVVLTPLPIQKEPSTERHTLLFLGAQDLFLGSQGETHRSLVAGDVSTFFPLSESKPRIPMRSTISSVEVQVCETLALKMCHGGMRCTVRPADSNNYIQLYKMASMNETIWIVLACLSKWNKHDQIDPADLMRHSVFSA